MNDCDEAVTLEHTAGRSRSAQTLGALTVYHLTSGCSPVKSSQFFLYRMSLFLHLEVQRSVSFTSLLDASGVEVL